MSEDEIIYDGEEKRDRAKIGITKKSVGQREIEERRDRIWEDRQQ